MDRRGFMKQVAFLASGVIMSNGILRKPEKLFAKSTGAESFSLSLITDNPDTAIFSVEKLIKNSSLHTETLRFTEVELPGEQISDIVLVRNSKLINYRTSTDHFSKNVARLAKELKMPEKLKNPVLLKFSTSNSGQVARKINVYHKNMLVAEYKIDDHVHEAQINGSKGDIVLSVQNSKVTIDAASCKHQTCVKMGHINRPGQNLVCIPNELRVEIEGKNALGLDSRLF